MDLKPIFPYDGSINQTNYYWFDGGFSTEEVDKIVKDAEQYEFSRALVIDEENTDKVEKATSNGSHLTTPGLG